MKTNRDIERHYFEQFRGAYELPEGALEYADKPDVLLRGERTTGIEITRFYLQDGSSPASEQKQKRLREAVVSDAQNLHRSAGGKKFELTITFKPDHPITLARRKILSKELAALAATLSDLGSGQLRADLFEEMPEILIIYLAR